MAGASARRTTAAPRAPFNSSIPLCKSQRYQRRLKSALANFMLVEPFHNTVLVSPVVLEEDFCLRKEAYLTFPLEVINFTIRKAIGRFKVNIENAIKHMGYVYCCCSWFVDLLQ